MGFLLSLLFELSSLEALPVYVGFNLRRDTIELRVRERAEKELRVCLVRNDQRLVFGEIGVVP